MPPAPTNGNRNAYILDELADYISAGLGFTIGYNFFIGTLPEPNENGMPNNVPTVFIYNNQSGKTDEYIDTEQWPFSIWAVASDTITAQTLIRQCYDILHRKGNYTLTNWYIYFSAASGIIRDEDKGKENSKLFSCDFVAYARNLNNVS